MKKIIYLLILSGIFSIAFPQTPDFTGIKVAIDPGHSGHEGDDRGMANGFWESESNLTKGLWLRDLLEARGAEVFLTRTTNTGDDSVDDWALSQRAALANTNNVDLFISIHSNAGGQNYPMPIYNGYTDAPTNPAAKEFAIVLWYQLISNEATYWTHTDPKWIGDLTLNPSWTNGYGVLYPLTVPGIISEGSFHDYQPEVDRLLSLDYRKQEAWNMMYAMAEYFNLTDSDIVGNISGLVRDSLLNNPNINVENCPDNFLPVKTSSVKLLETGEVYEVGDLNKAQWYFTNYPDKEADFNAGYYSFDSLAPGDYNLVFSGPNYYNDTVIINVSPHSFSYHNHWMKPDRTQPPKIISTTPSNGETINCFDPIFVAFNLNMDSTSFADAFSVTPQTDGVFTWDEEHMNVTFQPNIPYETNTEYTVTIGAASEHQWGVQLGKDSTFSFTTNNRNRYNLLNNFPVNEQTDLNPYLQFVLEFDAPILQTSLKEAISIITPDSEVITPTGNLVSVVDGKGVYAFVAEEELKYETTYTLRINGTVKDENYIPLVDTVEISFTTETKPDSSVVVDELDNIENWNIDEQNSSGLDNASFMYKYKYDKRSGEASVLLRYKFLSSDAFAYISATEPIGINEWNTEIGVWFWGDLSQNVLIFGFDSGEIISDTIDFAGWDYCSVSIPENTTELQYIKFSRSTNGAESGDVNLDAISKLYNPNGSTRVLFTNNDNVNIFPNPVTKGEVTVNGISGSMKYSVYNLLGQKLQDGIVTENGTIKLNESVTKTTNIILQLHNNDNSYSFKLINQSK